MGAVQRFTGFVAYELPDDFLLQDHMPLLGSHLGPDSEADIGTYKETYHQSKLVCCRLPNHKQSSVNMRNLTDPCIFAMGAGAVNRLGEKSNEIFKKYRFFLFQNISTYIRDVVDPLFMGQFKCISFAWTPRFNEGAEYVREIHSVEGFHPQAMILNMALHEHQYSDLGLQDLISATNAAYDKHGTYFLMHSGTFVNDTVQSSMPNSSVQEKHVRYIDGLVRSMLPIWYSLQNRYLNIHTLSRNLHLAKCGTNDGIHLSSKCNYQALVIQWDFNWLNYGRVIEPQFNVLKWSEVNEE